MKLWGWLAVVGAVVTVGGAVFIFSREAVAKEAGKKAFRVNAECTEVEVIDEEAAKQALVAAATLHFRGMDQHAIDLIVRALGQAIPQCPINDYMKISGIPGVPFGVTVGQVRAIVGDKTLEEVQDLAAQGGLPGIPGLEGAAVGPPGSDQASDINPVVALLAWLLGGVL